MSRHFHLSSELNRAIAKRLPPAKNQLSMPGSFFNQFVTDVYSKYILTIKTQLIYLSIYVCIYICNELIEKNCQAQKDDFWHVGVFWSWLY